MIAQIPTDPGERQALVDLARKRYLASTEYFQPWREKWVRFYKIYRAIRDEEQDSDEPVRSLSYAFGIVEDIAAKSAETLFARRPPCKVTPRRRGQEEAAENFSTVAANYFSGSDYQLDKMRSIKEKVITGSSYELDDWAEEYVQGRMWAPAQRTEQVDGGEATFTAQVEVELEIPEKVGYFTKFPSVFDVHPQPKVLKVKDMQWIVHEIREAAISDLQKRYYIDPASGEKIPVYDFSELLHDVGPHNPGEIQPVGQWDEHDYGEEAQLATSEGDSRRRNTANLDGVDRVWLVDVYEKDRIYTIAQGKYVIRCVKQWLHRPRLPWRIQVYTIDPQSLPGIGAIEPVEGDLNELQDVHNLSMQNWFRIINKMVAYNPDHVPFVDDWKPRAGGKVRVRSDLGDIRQSIMAIDQQDVTPSMLNQESNIRGLIESTLARSDLSPGTSGTKQTHKTLGGLLEIQRNMDTRFAGLLRLDLANYQAQMESMEAFFSQFGFEKRPYRQYRDDGSSALVEFSKDDIFTEGVGFDYVIEIDPSAGDSTVATNQLMVAFDLGLKYESWRVQSGGPQAKAVDLGEIYKRILMRLGWFDTSATLGAPSGVTDPGDELNMMLTGVPVRVQPGEDLIGHLTEHLIQRQSPRLLEAVNSGKAHPSALAILDAHLAETHQVIQQVMSDPQRAAQERFRSAIESQGG